MLRTFEAVVVRLEERLQVVARSSGLERWIGHSQFTLATSGAPLIGQIQHIRRAAEVAHVDGDASV